MNDSDKFIWEDWAVCVKRNQIPANTANIERAQIGFFTKFSEKFDKLSLLSIYPFTIEKTSVEICQSLMSEVTFQNVYFVHILLYPSFGTGHGTYARIIYDLRWRGGTTIRQCFRRTHWRDWRDTRTWLAQRGKPKYLADMSVSTATKGRYTTVPTRNVLHV